MLLFQFIFLQTESIKEGGKQNVKIKMSKLADSKLMSNEDVHLPGESALTEDAYSVAMRKRKKKGEKIIIV